MSNTKHQNDSHLGSIKIQNTESLIPRSCWYNVYQMITSVWLFGVSDVAIAKCCTGDIKAGTPLPNTQSNASSNSFAEGHYVLTNRTATVCSWLQLWKNLARIVLQPNAATLHIHY